MSTLTVAGSPMISTQGDGGQEVPINIDVRAGIGIWKKMHLDGEGKLGKGPVGVRKMYA